MDEIDRNEKMYYILGMGNPIEQYKKAEGEPELMANYEKLANEIERRMEKQTLGNYYTTLNKVLSERSVKAKYWPTIIKKTSEIIKRRDPELFLESVSEEKEEKKMELPPKSLPERKRKSSSFKVTPKIMSEARGRELFHSKRSD